uniref:Uncharacterized protein n=1 Tax=Podoviridae sp. ct8Lf7 TaxID=2827723 RepID=A0A8S5S0V2_9CAUD|nr:MAG TPA: hypothetical protein [Podoviridae sp. ct8Lf7]
MPYHRHLPIMIYSLTYLVNVFMLGVFNLKEQTLSIKYSRKTLPVREEVITDWCLLLTIRSLIVDTLERMENGLFQSLNTDTRA